MKICLLGQFGSGNSGNDGSLMSMLNTLGVLQPGARIVCACAEPNVVAARYGIPSLHLRSSKAHRANIGRFRRIMRLPLHLPTLFNGLRQLVTTDLLMVPGTGILDDFQEAAFGWPLTIFLWCLAARLTSTRIAFVSIGAGPIDSRVSRWLFRAATRMATYRSYRDKGSMEFVSSLGIDVSRDYVFPDLAFRLPRPTPAPRTALPASGPRVGVGVMTYHGWRKDNRQADAIYEGYVIKMSDFIARLSRQGLKVRIFMGDTVDRQVCAAIVERLHFLLHPGELALIETGSGTSLDDVMSQIASVDVTVVSRYHNLVCSLKMGCPAISLAYAVKNDQLMADFEQSGYCLHIDTFQVDALFELLSKLLTNLATERNRIATINERVGQSLVVQEHLLEQQLLDSRDHTAIR